LLFSTQRLGFGIFGMQGAFLLTEDEERCRREEEVVKE
jgi:hypothetical protein